MQKTKQEIATAITHVRDRIASDITVVYTVEQLAAWAGITTTVLKREFKAVYGCGPFGYLHKLRMEKAQRMIDDGYLPKAVGELLGYNQYTNFVAAFRRYWKMTPTAYKFSYRENKF